MISNIDLVNLLKNGVGGNFYPLSFPSASPDNSSQVEVMPLGATVGGVARVTVQIITRDVHPTYAEKKAQYIRSFLDGKTDFLIAENVQVVFVQANSLVPQYIGTDNNGRHLFSMNYNFILGV
ncbi:minor capsid protein [Bacillus haynesii]|uniref:minor capsid protein n=1 Tax=Bacillus haynesii TaxID=1925021 RepID=UPI00227F231E|nr:minor capsid protein [Bacillus haynesii]MCY8048449.1 minor capsid protein [Bacillus haynesii]MCY9324074.1 minor capsid protein [Bacillus haynesii]